MNSTQHEHQMQNFRTTTIENNSQCPRHDRCYSQTHSSSIDFGTLERKLQPIDTTSTDIKNTLPPNDEFQPTKMTSPSELKCTPFLQEPHPSRGTTDYRIISYPISPSHDLIRISNEPIRTSHDSIKTSPDPIRISHDLLDVTKTSSLCDKMGINQDDTNVVNQLVNNQTKVLIGPSPICRPCCPLVHCTPPRSGSSVCRVQFR